ncbi:MAG: FesM [Anaerolineae bacterium]|jgi:hypothetical protein
MSSRPDTFDVLRLPLIGPFLRWRHARSAAALPLLVLAGLMVFDGIYGPQLAPKNLATVLVWVHYRGLVVLALLLAGNLFCFGCPFMLVRNAARRLTGRYFSPTRVWPRPLRGKWLAAGLFALLLFLYELFDLWATPLWTAWLMVAYFAGALVVDSLFRGAAFCKHLCPLGQFNFLSATLSPLEVTVRDRDICATCPTKDCIAGRQLATSDNPSPVPDLPGCQLWLYQPRKVGNLDCTFCLDCVHACPYDNVGVTPRLPAAGLGEDPRRSGIGRLSQRADLAALATLFAFGALLNAFAMVSPVYALEDWLAATLGTNSEVIVLGLIFLGGLVAIPATLLALAGALSSRAAAPSVPLPQGVLAWATRFAYALIPLGFGVWLAHYTFHFLTGFLTVIPLFQSFVGDLAGMPLLGAPRWDLAAVVPDAWLYPLELGFLGLGWFGSLLVAAEIAAREAPGRRWRVAAPWLLLLSLLLLFAVWLMGQPMEMRGTFLAG